MVSLFAVASFVLAGCAPPANTNTNTNTNTNANSAPKAAAPTADSLMALDTKAFDAWKNRDGKYFEGYLADNFVGFGDDGKRPTRAESLQMITGHKCDVKSFTLSEPHMTQAGADAAVLTYKAVADGTCEGQKIPSPVTAASVFVRSGDTWKGAYHNEVAVIEPKTPAVADNTNKSMPSSSPAASSQSNSGSNTASSSNTTSAKGNTTTASNSNTAASGDAALTDTLMGMEKKGWEAWKAKDAAGFADLSDKDFAFIDTMGKATYGKANGIKMWTTDNPCNVSSVNVSDGHASMITKDVAILTFKGTGEGTCGDMKLAPLWGTTVFVKEGDAWKVAYIFETPMRKM